MFSLLTILLLLFIKLHFSINILKVTVADLFLTDTDKLFFAIWVAGILNY